MLKIQLYNYKYHYKPYKLMVFIYLFIEILTNNINNQQINNKITVPGGGGGGGVIKLTRLKPPLAAVMSITTKIKQGKHSYVS